ncbi:MAG: hypothetical protein HXX15_22715 [Rhodopseudomonas sp.]|uniref:hypothetical protein n=1 Tax=Rhodopseudomonas sp. TaxID=1078 RepID=UPI00181AF964|nr:hypothetical protein [Rhodopseudomonas sp.]NVN88898.1 hypothetical protein [Rhodopseudomonas sp.]
MRDIVLRPGTAADAAACGTICYAAFKAIGMAHNFPPEIGLAMFEVFGTNRTSRDRLRISVGRGGPEVAGRLPGWRF